MPGIEASPGSHGLSTPYFEIRDVKPDTLLSERTFMRVQPQVRTLGLGCFDGPAVSPDRVVNIVQILATGRHKEGQITVPIDFSKVDKPLPTAEAPIEEVLSAGAVAFRYYPQKTGDDKFNGLPGSAKEPTIWDLFCNRPLNVVHVKNCCSEGYYLIDGERGVAIPITQADYRFACPAMLQYAVGMSVSNIFPLEDVPFLVNADRALCGRPWLNQTLAQAILDKLGSDIRQPRFDHPVMTFGSYDRLPSLFSVPPAHGWDRFSEPAVRYCTNLQQIDAAVGRRNNLYLPSEFGKAWALLFLEQVMLHGTAAQKQAYAGLISQAKNDLQYPRVAQVKGALTTLPACVTIIGQTVEALGKTPAPIPFVLPKAGR